MKGQRTSHLVAKDRPSCSTRKVSDRVTGCSVMLEEHNPAQRATQRELATVRECDHVTRCNRREETRERRRRGHLITWRRKVVQNTRGRRLLILPAPVFSQSIFKEGRIACARRKVPRAGTLEQDSRTPLMSTRRQQPIKRPF